MGEYGGRNFKKGGGKPSFLGGKGDKGIPPSMPGARKAGGGKSDYLGERGDKGMSHWGAKGSTSKPPMD
jgi:hypothetical protein